MDKFKLLESMTDIDEKYLIESENYKVKKVRTFNRYKGFMVASIGLVLIASAGYLGYNNPSVAEPQTSLGVVDQPSQRPQNVTGSQRPQNIVGSTPPQNIVGSKPPVGVVGQSPSLKEDIPIEEEKPIEKPVEGKKGFKEKLMEIWIKIKNIFKKEADKNGK